MNRSADYHQGYSDGLAGKDRPLTGMYSADYYDGFDTGRWYRKYLNK